MDELIRRDEAGIQTRKDLGIVEDPFLGEDETPELERILYAFLRRKLLILLVVVMVVVPAAVATYLATPLYRSVVMLEIDPEPVQILPYSEIAEVVGGGANYDLYMKTQDEILRGPSLTARVTERLKSKLESEQYSAIVPLGGAFEVMRLENTKLFQLSFVAEDPEGAATVANTYAEEFIKQHFESRQKTREQARVLLERELSELRLRVEASEEELIQYAQDNNMISLGAEGQDVVEQKLSFLSQEVASAETAVILARSKVESLEGASADDFPERLRNSVIADLTSRLLLLQKELTSLRTQFGENWPSVVRMKREIEVTQEQLALEKVSAIDEARQEVQIELQEARRKLNLLTTSLSRQEELVNRLNEAGIQYNILRRDVETNEELYNGLLEKLKQTSVTAGLEFGNIHIVEPGRVSLRAFSPKVSWNLSIAAFLGLALGMVTAFLAEFWDKSINTVIDAERLTQIPSLGVVPEIKALRSSASSKRKSELKIADSRTLLLSEKDTKVQGARESNGDIILPPEARESFRGICASILLSRSDRAPQRILVTSAIPDEGKTSIASLLGQSLSESGARTVLVEFDLRKPRLSSSFGFGAEEGLSLFLAGHVSPLPKLHPAVNPNLFVISAGPKPPNPLALIQSDKTETLIEKLRESFQFVLIDSPPVLTVADARVLASKVDGVVLVVRAGKTPGKLVARTKMMLKASGANILGLVLNGADLQSYDSGYYRYYEDKSYYTGAGESA